jgi:predicted TIM-barrel fold metal-dependent hydrolase
VSGAPRQIDREVVVVVAVIDAQIHLWAGAGSSPRHGSSPFTVEEALRGMDEAGVDAAVIHPPGWDPDAPDYAVEVVKARPERFARYTTVDPTAADAPEQVRRVKAEPGVLGVRYLCFQPHEQVWPQDGNLDRVFALTEKEGVPVTLCGPVVMPIVARTAARYPDLKIVVDHFGLINYAPDGGLLQSPDVHSWARYPNVAVKLTGAPDYATDPYPFPAMIDVVRALHDAYGAERLFWGTDITRVNGHGGTKYKASWRECVTMFTDHMPWLSSRELTLIMGEAYSAWHGWYPYGLNNRA